MISVIYLVEARRHLAKLPPDMRARIIAKIERYAMEGAGDVTRLVGRDLFRLRVGDYRVLFAEREMTMVITKVDHRSTVY